MKEIEKLSYLFKESNCLKTVAFFLPFYSNFDMLVIVNHEGVQIMKILLTMGSPYLNENLDILKQYKDDVIVLKPLKANGSHNFKEIGAPAIERDSEGNIYRSHYAYEYPKDLLFGQLEPNEDVVIITDITEQSFVPVLFFTGYANDYNVHLWMIKPQSAFKVAGIMNSSFHHFHSIHGFYEEDYLQAIYELAYKAPYTIENQLKKDLTPALLEKVREVAVKDISKRLSVFLEKIKQKPGNQINTFNDYANPYQKYVMDTLYQSQKNELEKVMQYIETISAYGRGVSANLSQEDCYALSAYGDYIANREELRQFAMYWDTQYEKHRGMIHEDVKKGLISMLAMIQENWSVNYWKKDYSALDIFTEELLAKDNKGETLEGIASSNKKLRPSNSSAISHKASEKKKLRIQELQEGVELPMETQKKKGLFGRKGNYPML